MGGGKIVIIILYGLFTCFDDAFVAQARLRGLLDNLLGLQRVILTNNKETCSIVGGAKEDGHGNGGMEGSDEEIPSDSEEETSEQDDNDVTSDQSEEEEKEESTVVRKRLKRKRKRPDWVSNYFFLSSTIPPHPAPMKYFYSLKVTISGRRDYEGYIARTHECLKSFRNSTVEKWSKKTKIASGKITSKVRNLFHFELLEAIIIFVSTGLHASGPFSLVTN